MATTDYQRHMEVSATPDQVYDALTTGYANWWTTPDQPIKQVGDRIKFAFGGESYWIFEAVTLTPTRVDLKCVEAHLILTDHPGEVDRDWLNSHLIWEIKPNGGTTHIDFTHAGLTENLICYDICSRSWDHFLADSLQAFLDTGEGKPN